MNIFYLRFLAFLFLAFGLITNIASISAQTCVTESEPNNQPANATPISTSTCIEGEQSGEDQDLFIWTVSAEEAEQEWQVSFLPLPNQVSKAELLQLELSENGQEVLDKKVLFTLNATDNRLIETRGILLPAGSYYWGISHSGSGIEGENRYQLNLQASDWLIDGAESEPNDGKDSATLLPNNGRIAGNLQASEDWYRWLIDDKAATQRQHLLFTAPLGESVSLRLLTDDQQTLLSFDLVNGGELDLPALGLAAGEYWLHLTGAMTSDGEQSLPYILALSADGERMPRLEEEPNDDFASAYAIAPDAIPIEGSFPSRRDPDVYRFTVDETFAAQQWEIVATGWDAEGERMEGGAGSPNEMELCLLDGKGEILQCRKSTMPSLPDLMLQPGEYGLSLRSVNDLASDYTLEWFATGEANNDQTSDQTSEAEPNDNLATANPILRAGESEGKVAWQGRFVGTEDDYYQLTTVEETQMWRVQATGVGLASLIYLDVAGNELARQSANGSGLVRLEDLYLLPGSHLFRLAGSDSDYTLHLIPLGILTSTTDSAINTSDAEGVGSDGTINEHEPNDGVESAERLIFNQPIEARLNNLSDYDIYRFSLMGTERVRITLTPPSDGQFSIDLDLILSNATNEIGQPWHYEAILSGGDYHLYLNAAQPSSEPYTLLIERLNPLETTTDSATDVNIDRKPLPVEIALFDPTTASPMVAAYVGRGQALTLQVALTNTTQSSQALTLSVQSSDVGWQPAISEQQMTVAAGAAQQIELPLKILPNARADLPAQISVRAEAVDGSYQTTSLEIPARCEANLVNPQPTWTSAGDLRGGLNVAWRALGATPVDESGNTRIPDLFDTIISDFSGWEGQPGDSVTVALASDLASDLAGDTPLPIAGIILNPQSHLPAHQQLRHFELLLSQDGENFQSVYQGELNRVAMEQSFVLSQTVDAAFARLRVIDNWQGSGAISVGEFKVIAASQPSTIHHPLSTTHSFNLLDPKLGGHIVWTTPLLYEAQELLKPERGSLTTPVADQAIEWVVGFHHNRAAQINQLGWLDSAEALTEQRIQQVEVSISLATPLGPWQTLTTWSLDPTSTVTQLLSLPAPVWARYVRFVIRAESLSQSASQLLYLPNQLSLYERPTRLVGDATYRSILAEWGGAWGGYAQSAIYEDYQAVIAIENTVNERENNNSAQEAQPLTADQLVHGFVEVGKDEDWFRLSLPKSANTIQIQLAGDAGLGQTNVNVDYELLDHNGTVVSTTSSLAGSGLVITATGLAEGDYALRLFDPKRSIVFSWDTSGSVGKFLPTIYQALNGFANQIDPNVEVINLLPFADPPQFLLDGWSHDHLAVQSALNNYPRLDSSSSVESNLLAASEVLAARSGRRAVLLLTDADTSSYQDTLLLWKSLAKSKAHLFTFEINGLGLPTQDLMQDLATVNQGLYEHINSLDQFERHFARALCALRRPAEYQVRVAYSQEAVEPASVEPTITPTTPITGTLRVVSGSATGETATSNSSLSDSPLQLAAAVELIVDASGSMLQRIEGQTRIQIARQTLLDLVSKRLPVGTPLALRVFGHREAGSCRTDLEIPLQPLDVLIVSQAIERIEAQNLAKTPIAASLRLVGEDLSSHVGRKVVILLTDGEETCGGDPAAEIAQLRASGVDVRVNIIGFAIDDANLQQTFAQWAEQGGGTYVNANNAQELSAALINLAAVPYQVLDADENEVARGFVNGPAITAPVGVYTLKILAEPAKQIEQVEIRNEEEQTVRVEDAD